MERIFLKLINLNPTCTIVLSGTWKWHAGSPVKAGQVMWDNLINNKITKIFSHEYT
jgi:hypothetical protein